MQVYPTKEHRDPKLRWNDYIDEPVPPPFDIKNIRVEVTYFDLQRRAYSGSGKGRYIFIESRGNRVTVTPELVNSNVPR
jgi:hypothetical protein